MEDDETVTAYHESGHAVMAYVLGGRVDSMQLWGEADDYLPARFGDCRVAWGRVDPSTDFQRQREIMTILAGPVAEMIYLGEKLHPATHGPWQHDWQMASSIAAGIVPNLAKRTRLLELILLELHRRMIDDWFWAAIASLSDELQTHELLEEDQVAEVVEFWLSRDR